MRYFGAGDFDVEDRVSATEGEQVVGAKAFGAYGDEDEIGTDEADFGNIGVSHFGNDESYGEVDTYDVMSIGDFDDGDTLGKAMTAMDASSVSRRRKKSFTAQRKPMFTSSQSRVASPLIKHQQAILQKKVQGFAAANRNQIAQTQRKAMVEGKPIPSVAQLIPAGQRAAMVKQATHQAAIITQAQNATPGRAGMPVMAAASAMNRAQASNIGPVAHDGAVVVTPEQAVNQTLINETSAQAVAKSILGRSQYAHPLATMGGYEDPVGDYDEAMGKFRFKKPSVSKLVKKALPPKISAAVSKV
jgi:hypothetical protein